MWLFLDWSTLAELERSHYSACIYECGEWQSPASMLDQLAASIWVNRAVTEYQEWVWP